MKIEALKKYLPHSLIKKKVREVAVKKVRRDLILHGKSEKDISASDLEYLLADAEESVWSDLKQTSLIGALAMLGLNFF